MKIKVLNVLILLMMFNSCSSNSNDALDGPNKKDEIGLTKREIQFGKNGGKEFVSTKNNKWTIDNITLNDKVVDFKSTEFIIVEDEYKNRISIKGNFFEIEKVNAGVSISIIGYQAENSIMCITLRINNYFESITVKFSNN